MSDSTKKFPSLASIEAKLVQSSFPEFRAGDKVRVHVRIDEGDKERIQVFEGVCIHRSHRGCRGSFTVRKVSHGIGVERVWTVNSPRVTKVELVSRGVVRRAKLYYLRERSGNAARIREKIGGYKSAGAASAR
ncbi:MAG: 50S ribosomal protein L19 [Myxococcales bacterium FL481]|nr:MAG: 50S ribosomal protein L19 [Myxococcales bacterium FL481]